MPPPWPELPGSVPVLGGLPPTRARVTLCPPSSLTHTADPNRTGPASPARTPVAPLTAEFGCNYEEPHVWA